MAHGVTHEIDVTVTVTVVTVSLAECGVAYLRGE
jgi:hypothetical protein